MLKSGSNGCQRSHRVDNPSTSTPAANTGAKQRSKKEGFNLNLLQTCSLWSTQCGLLDQIWPIPKPSEIPFYDSGGVVRETTGTIPVTAVGLLNNFSCMDGPPLLKGHRKTPMTPTFWATPNHNKNPICRTITTHPMVDPMVAAATRPIGSWETMQCCRPVFSGSFKPCMYVCMYSIPME